MIFVGKGVAADRSRADAGDGFIGRVTTGLADREGQTAEQLEGHEHIPDRAGTDRGAHQAADSVVALQVRLDEPRERPGVAQGVDDGADGAHQPVVVAVRKRCCDLVGFVGRQQPAQHLDQQVQRAAGVGQGRRPRQLDNRVGVGVMGEGLAQRRQRHRRPQLAAVDDDEGVHGLAVGAHPWSFATSAASGSSRAGGCRRRSARAAPAAP